MEEIIQKEIEDLKNRIKELERSDVYKDEKIKKLSRELFDLKEDLIRQVASDINNFKSRVIELEIQMRVMVKLVDEINNIIKRGKS